MYIKSALIVSLLLLSIIHLPCAAQTEQEFNLVSAILNELRPDGIQLSPLTNGDNEIQINGVASNPKQIAEYIKAIKVANTGNLVIRGISPADENNRRVFLFRFAIKAAIAVTPSPTSNPLSAIPNQEALLQDSAILLNPKYQDSTVDSISPKYSINDLLTYAKSIEIKEKSFMHSPLASLSDGDFVNVSLSPYGDKLAYAKAIFQEGQEIQELTEIAIYDLKAKKSQLLLNAEDSKQYAVYKAFVYGMSWKEPDELVASISDGDVDSTTVKFNAENGEIISTEYVEAGLEQEDIDNENSLAQKLFEIFPSWDINVLTNFTRNALFVSKRAIISQRNYNRYNTNLILLDLEHKQAIPLVYMGDGMQYAMAGGSVLPDGDAIFSLRTKEGIGIFRLSSENSVLPLGFISSNQQNHTPRLVVKHISKTGIYFLVELNRSYEQGNNPIYYYSKKLGLVRCSDFQEIYDIDVSKDGRSVAVIYWNANQRNIRVAQHKELIAE
jgi:hypothetical protein